MPLCVSYRMPGCCPSIPEDERWWYVYAQSHAKTGQRQGTTTATTTP
jgi:hypothetical protein